MDKLIEVLSESEAQAVVVALIGLAFALVKRAGIVKEWKLEKAAECIEVGVRNTYEDYVRSLKEANEDGKLTAGERREAMNRAIRTAGDYAAQQGVDLLSVYAKEYLPVLVDKVVQGQKGAASTAA